MKNFYLISLFLIGWSVNLIAQDGSSCDNAIVIESGLHNTSEAPQWFEYTAPSSGMLTISSVGYTNTDTYLRLYSGCADGLVFFAANDDAVGLQSELILEVVEGQLIKILWDDTFSSAAFNWSIVIDGGSSCSNAIPVTAGEFIVDAAPQWFSYTAGSNEEVTISSVGFTGVDTYLGTTSGCVDGLVFSDQSDDAVDQQSELTFTMDAGETVRFLWDDTNSELGFTWALTVKGGFDCENAIEVEEGFHATISAPQWFSYTAESNEEVTISSVGATGVDTYLRATTECGVMAFAESDDASGLQSELTFNMNAGETVRFVWEDVNSESGFNWYIFAKEGFDCDNSIAVDEGIHSTFSAPQWFTYTASVGELVTISSVGFTASDTYLRLYNNCEEEPFAVSDDASGFQSELTIVLQAGESVQILWDDTFSSQGFDWELSSEVLPDPGAACITAVEVEEGEHSFETAPYYYEFTAPAAGDYAITSLGYTNIDTYLYVYASCDAFFPLASDDDEAGTLQSAVTVNLQEGQNIKIVWDDQYSTEGFEWLISREPCTFNTLELSAEVTANTSIYGNGSISLTTTAGFSNFTYSWDNGDVGPIIEDLLMGEYEVTITDYLGCVYQETFTVGGVTASSDALEFSLKVFPNPASEIIKIESAKKIGSFEIFDINGRVVMNKIIEKDAADLDISMLRSGVYFVAVAGSSKLTKFVKQ